ncbi:hypothetical protein KWD77_16575 [Acinetobacter baumannii]
MDAKNFIRNRGFKKARSLLDERDAFVHVEKPTHFDTDLEIFIHEKDFKTDRLDESDICLSDLERLVTSIEIIDLFESIKGAKDAHKNGIGFHTVLIGGYEIPIERLGQAVTDHESIYSVLRIDDMGDDSNLDHHVSPFCEVRDI